MAVTAANIEYPHMKKVLCTVAFDSSYPTGGESISASAFGLGRFKRIDVAQPDGYIIQPIIASNEQTALLKVFRSAGFTPAGTNGTSSVTAQTFTGTSPSTALNLASPAFSGTGLTAAGQVITTTSTHTMTLNECAGMWLISATGTTPPNLILSNTAVTAAAAVLTVQGSANTDAGAYKIVKPTTPAGTNSTSTAAAQTFTGTAVAEGVLNEVDNATDISSLTAVVLTIDGY